METSTDVSESITNESTNGNIIIITHSPPFAGSFFHLMDGLQAELQGGQQSITSDSLEENITNQSFHEQPTFKRVCSKDFINSLSVQKVSHVLVEKKTTCALCLEELELGEDVIELPCLDKHYFHIKKVNEKEGIICEGIFPWLKENTTCPMCRHTFPSEEKKVELEESEESDELGELDITSTSPPIILTRDRIFNMMNQVMEDEEERMLQEVLYQSLQTSEPIQTSEPMQTSEPIQSSE